MMYHADMNEEIVEAEVSAFVGKVVFIYYNLPYTVDVHAIFSGDLSEFDQDGIHTFKSDGMGTSMVFTVKSVEKIIKSKNLNGDDCLYIYLKVREQWQIA